MALPSKKKNHNKNVVTQRRNDLKLPRSFSTAVFPVGSLVYQWVIVLVLVILYIILGHSPL